MAFIVVSFILVAIAESLHHIPGLGFFNDISGKGVIYQAVLLILSAIIYVVGTWLSLKSSQKRFEKLDI